MRGGEVVDAGRYTRIRTATLPITVTGIELRERRELTEADGNGAIEEIVIEK